MRYDTGRPSSVTRLRITPRTTSLAPESGPPPSRRAGACVCSAASARPVAARWYRQNEKGRSRSKGSRPPAQRTPDGRNGPAGLVAEGPTAKARELDNVRGGSMGIDDGSPQGRFVGLKTAVGCRIAMIGRCARAQHDGVCPRNGR